MSEQPTIEQSITKFNDLAMEKKIDFEGEKIEIDQIINEEIKILNYEVLTTTKFKPEGSSFAVIQAEVEGKKITFTASEIIANQLQKLVPKEKLPILSKIITVKSKLGRKYNCLA